eukprot:6828172-Karenia_brevis.AAC.1
MFKCRVDRTHKVKYGHRTQLVQTANTEAQLLTPEEAARIGWNPECAGTATTGPSIYYESVWFQVIKYDQIPNGSTFNMIWNPALEARPDHICRLYGDNRGTE